MADMSQEYRKAAQLAEQLFGNENGEFADLPLPDGDDLPKELTTWLYGYLMQGRSRISIKLKLLSTVGMLTALQREEDLICHWIKAALKYGCSKDEVREVIITTSIYAGWPAARRGLRVSAVLLS